MLVDFDTDEVRALATDENAKAIRLQGLVVAGILTVDEAGPSWATSRRRHPLCRRRPPLGAGRASLICRTTRACRPGIGRKSG
jgi:hypothetical protein